MESCTEIDAARWAIASTSRTQRRHRFTVADVADLEWPQVRMILEPGQVEPIPGHEIVDRQHVVTSFEEVGDDPSADEPGRTGDEDPHAIGRPSVATRSRACATIVWTASVGIGDTASDR